MFSFALISILLEIHLLNFGASHVAVALCFMLDSAVYLFFSLFGSRIFKNIDERIVMAFGLVMIGLAYLMLAPWGLIFPDNV